jgi:hypothetical protein
MVCFRQHLQCLESSYFGTQGCDNPGLKLANAVGVRHSVSSTTSTQYLFVGFDILGSHLLGRKLSRQSLIVLTHRRP